MVGMRNRLVHLYDDVDDALVAHAAGEELGDWDAFARAIASYVEAETGASTSRARCPGPLPTAPPSTGSSTSS
jgi:hypothetical protein